MSNFEKCVDFFFNEKEISNLAFKVGKNNTTLFEYYKSATSNINSETLFDIASVSKVVSVTQLALIALDKGLLNLEDNVSKFFATDKDIKIKNLLTHTIGIGYKNLCVEGVNYNNIAEHILSIPSDIPIGSDVLYSCPAFILLGKICEKVFSKPLDLLFKEYVATPLNLNKTTYKPNNSDNIVNANHNPEAIGIVNDNNCKYLGGVSGNAGLFSNVSDLEKFCQALISHATPLYSEKTFEMSLKNYTKGMAENRALGYIYIDETYERTGNLMPTGSIGHGGYTGQLIACDIKSGLYVIVLTDIAKSIDKKYNTIERTRVNHIISSLCNAIKEDLNL